MKGRFIEFIEIPSEMDKGDFSTFKRGDGTHGIIYCCPTCGGVSAGTDKHNFDEKTLSCKPSLIHKCGFHKTLTNGVYT